MMGEQDAMMEGPMSNMQGDNMSKMMMGGMRKMAMMRMRCFLGFFWFIQVFINIGSIVSVANWAEEDDEDEAFILAVIFCALLWIFTILAGMWFCKPSMKTLMWFRPMWWTLIIVSVIDLIMIGGETWEISIINSNMERTWIVAGDCTNIVFCCYNLGILRGWVRMGKMAMMAKKMADRPKNIWDGKKTWEKTDCYKQFFGRSWYFQATTAEGKGAAELDDFFAECYGWIPG